MKTAFEDEDAPAPKRAKTEMNGAGKRTNGATKKVTKTGEFGILVAEKAGLGNCCKNAPVACLSCN